MSRRKLKGRTIRVMAVAGTFLFLFGVTSSYLLLIRKPPKAEAAWYNSAWSYRKKYVVNNSYVSTISGTTLSNFPVLVNVTDPDIRYTTSGGNTALTTGNDIIFTDSDGTTLLNYEIESYTSTSGSLQSWVKLPTIAPTGSYSFYMYYGNAAAGANSSANMKATWNSNFIGVWHMNDNAANKNVVESTTNGFTGTNVANTSTKTTGGRTANGLTFNGTADAITMGTSTTLGATTAYTMSVWVNATTWSNNAPMFKKDVDFIFRYNTGGGCNTSLMEIVYWTASNTLRCSDATAPSTGGWHFLTATIVAGDVGGIYVDGVQTNGSVATNGSGTRVLTNTFQIGGDASHSEYFTGSMDEARVENTNASADWINTDYNTQQFPSTFLIATSQEFNPAPAPPSVPTLIYPPASATAVSIIPQFQLRSSDANADYITYYISLYSGGSCSTLISNIDQSSSTTNWLHMDANSATAFSGASSINDSSVATYQYPPALTPNTTYSWTGKAKDPGGNNTYSTIATCQSFTTGTSEVKINGGTNITGGTNIQ